MGPLFAVGLNMDTLIFLFGEGDDLNPVQMGLRAIVVFIITLMLIRAAGRRAFGQKSPFDACTTVLLGAVLSRAVVGASPFWSTVAAGLALVLMHRAIAVASIKWAWFDELVNGHEREFIHDGRVDLKAMRKGLIHQRDLAQATRQKTGQEDPARVRRAVLERNGEITIVERADLHST